MTPQQAKTREELQAADSEGFNDTEGEAIRLNDALYIYGCT